MATSTSGTVNAVIADVKTIATKSIALAKLELTPKLVKLGVGIGLLVVSLFFAFTALHLMLFAGALGLAKAFGGPTGWIALGFLVAGLIFLLLGGLIGVLGLLQLKKGAQLSPKGATTEAKQSVSTAQAAISRASSRAGSDDVIKADLAPVRSDATDGDWAHLPDPHAEVVGTTPHADAPHSWSPSGGASSTAS